MQMLKVISKFAHWIARENGFSQLSAEAKRAAWKNVGLTHALLLPVTFGFVLTAPALKPTLRDIVCLHFMLALLLATLVEIVSAIYELFRLPALSLVSSGWFFAFAVTLLPLLLIAFTLWALG